MSVGVVYQSRAPHKRSTITSSYQMREVIFALVPVIIFSTLYFGYRVLLVLLLSVSSALASELLIEILLRRRITLGDFSAAITGLIFALSLPVNVAWWIPVAGSAAAILVFKGLFGGIGKNILNPAIAARVVTALVFSEQMSSLQIDGISVATPLVSMYSDTLLFPSKLSCFLGVVPGCIGETSTLLILLGGIYLISRRLIDFRIPFAMITTVFILSYVLGRDGLDQILTGSLMLTAFFVATDYVTSPMNSTAKWIVGVAGGLIVVLIRFYTPFNEGTSAAVLVMNLLTLPLDRFLVPAPYGTRKKQKNTEEKDDFEEVGEE